MELIEKLSAMIADEMHGAAEYAHCAMRHKQDHPKLAEAWHEMAEQETAHMNKLIEAAREELKAMQTAYSQA